jgi:DNA-binding SARP family transcriptional activator
MSETLVKEGTNRTMQETLQEWIKEHPADTTAQLLMTLIAESVAGLKTE